MVAKWRNVTSTKPTNNPMATPLIPKAGWLAKKKITVVLTIAPIKLLIIAALAKSSACKVACRGPWQ